MNKLLSPDKITFGLGFSLSLSIFSIPVYFFVPKFYTLPVMHHDFHDATWSYPEAMLYTFGLWIVFRTIKHFVS